MPDVGPGPPAKELLKNPPFQKGEWPVETFIDVGFDGVYKVFDTPANAGLRPPVGDIQEPTGLGVCVRATRRTVSDGSGEFSSAMGEHDRRTRPDAGRDWRGGDERLQHGDGAGHHGGGTPRYQGAQGNYGALPALARSGLPRKANKGAPGASCW